MKFWSKGLLLTVTVLTVAWLTSIAFATGGPTPRPAARCISMARMARAAWNSATSAIVNRFLHSSDSGDGAR